MENHPPMEKLEQLQQGKLRGTELLETLDHLENCDECYQNLPPQNTHDFLNRIFQIEEKEDLIEEDVKCEI